MIIAQADATHIPLADDSVGLIFTSPPYTDARTYGIGAQRHCQQWIDWRRAQRNEMAAQRAIAEALDANADEQARAERMAADENKERYMPRTAQCHENAEHRQYRSGRAAVAGMAGAV